MHPYDIESRWRNAKPQPAFSKNIFDEVNARAAGQVENLITRWFANYPKKVGNELQWLNPTRSDNKVGSFSVNRHTGKWADFATGDKGGDVISLYAYVHGVSQLEAARVLADELGVSL
jgi:hypothetical protein